MYNLKVLEKTLDNGLHVTLVQKPGYHKSLFMCGAPVGGFDVQQLYQEEKIVHPSGCAHFLEHQMFRLHGKDVMEDFAYLQSQANAFTSYQETCYYFQTTGDIEKPLALLLEFVETLDITEQSVNKEKGIILNEYDMDAQSPETRLLKETYKSLYQYHPIRNEILGTRDDIANMSVEQLSLFYRLNYDPARLKLVGVTGNELEPILSFIEQHQKDFPSKLESIPSLYVEKEESEVYRKEFHDSMDISSNYVCVAYKFDGCKSVEEGLRQDVSIQVRLDSLFSAMNPDFQFWLDQHIITQIAGAECDFTEDRGYILFYAQTRKVDEFIELVHQIINKMEHENMDPSLFETIKNSYIGQGIRGLDHFENLSMELVHAHFNQYNYFDSLEIIKRLNSKDIDKACQTLHYSNSTVTKITPNHSISSEME